MYAKSAKDLDVYKLSFELVNGNMITKAEMFCKNK